MMKSLVLACREVMPAVLKLKKDLKNKASKKQADIMQRFFKTQPGQYGSGDVFLGVKVPQIRKIVKKYFFLEEKEILSLLYSKIHEERLAALLIMIDRFEKGREAEKKRIFRLYLKNIGQVNSWDLVDISSPKIIGYYLLNRSKKPLYRLACSDNLWQKRTALVATIYFIKQDKFEDALKIIDMLLYDEHDLIQKAAGWMLREIGKRDLNIEENFLKKRYKVMPRTALRYAIEKFPENKRKKYLYGKA